MDQPKRKGYQAPGNLNAQKNKPYTRAVQEMLDAPLGQAPEAWGIDRKKWTHAQELVERDISLALSGDREAIRMVVERAEGRVPTAPEDREIAKSEAEANRIGGMSALWALQIALGLRPKDAIEGEIVETPLLGGRMRIGYADPPYPGYAYKYKNHPDYAGEVDHAALIARLEAEYDGWVLHTNSPSIALLAPLVPPTARWMAWVKPFAAFKRNVPVAYAWEPVIVKPVRKPVVSGRIVMRDWVSENITMKRGLTGAKPEAVCRWAFEMLGAEPSDELDDLFPGTGAVGIAWADWKSDLNKTPPTRLLTGAQKNPAALLEDKSE